MLNKELTIQELRGKKVKLTSDLISWNNKRLKKAGSIGVVENVFTHGFSYPQAYVKIGKRPYEISFSQLELTD